MLGSVDPASMIVFKPANGEVKHTVTIFTDVDCGYCRQFHREIDKVTALGIEVHYLFYPRTGPNTESWTKADQVWCAADHNSALTRAKLGGEIPDGAACATPVETHYELGQRIGVRGTPAIFSEAGELLGGYLPPATLAKVLDDPNAVIENSSARPMEWITSPEAWVALTTLTLLEIVLGVDNIIFISILVGRLPEEQRQRGARARPRASRWARASCCCCS